MHIFSGLILVFILVLLLIALLHRYYHKTSREFALLRTGFGGRRIVLDGACLVLPFMHQLELIPLRGHQLILQQRAAEALVTGDSLRVEVTAEFALRVAADEESIAAAATALGAQSIHSEGLYELFHGRLSDAVQQVVSRSSLGDLHKGRHQFAEAVSSILKAPFGDYGLTLDAVSILQLDQAPLEIFDQNNVFDAVGLRQLGSVLSEQRLQRVTVEAQAEVSAREIELDAMRRKLELEQQQSDIELAQRQRIESARAKSEADIETVRQQAQRQSEEARLTRELEVRQLEVERDTALREQQAVALQRTDSAQLESQVALAQKRGEESEARAEAELKRATFVQAQDSILREKETLAAVRNADVAMIRQRHLSALHAEESGSAEQIKLASAKAEAEIAKLRAEVERARGEVKAQSIAALAQAENLISEQLLAHKIDLEKVRVLPEIAKRVSKPLEKIESIRINHLGGMGGGTLSGGGSSPLGDSLEQVMSLAVQMPALKKLGEEIGLDFDPQLGGRMADAAGRIQGVIAKAPKQHAATEAGQNNLNNPQENGQ